MEEVARQGGLISLTHMTLVADLVAENRRLQERVQGLLEANTDLVLGAREARAQERARIARLIEDEALFTDGDGPLRIILRRMLRLVAERIRTRQHMAGLIAALLRGEGQGKPTQGGTDEG